MARALGQLASVLDERGEYGRARELLERALLLRVVRPLAQLSQERRARLEALLSAAPGESLSGGEQLDWAELLILRGEALEAARRYQALLRGGSLGALRVQALLGCARAQRLAGEPEAAWAALQELSAAEGALLDVLEERCRILRARGQQEAAIGEYVLALGALEHEDVSAWWRLAEDLARTYVEAKRYREARTFLEGLRSRDREFGSDPQRRARFLKLMREVDLLAARAD